MKKTTFLIFAIAVSIPAISLAETEYLDIVESDVVQATGTTTEITKRAKTCMAQILKNDEVRIEGSSSTGFIPTFASMSSEGKSDGITGGSVIVDFDLDGGTVTANSRVDYRSSFLAKNVKSTVLFQAKDGRFKIKHSNIEYLQKSTGSGSNSGYMKARKSWGTGWEDARDELEKLSDNISQCVMKTASDNW